MFEIIFLGTSASAPSIHRGLPASVVLAGEYRFMVDCGEGSQRQILRSGLGYKKLNKFLFTHSHLDHILGIGGIASTFARWEALDELEIWGSKQVLDRVETLIFDVVFGGQTPPVPIHLIHLTGGQFIDTKEFTISAFPVTHRGAGNFGFIFQEKSRRPFLVEQAEALGVPAGPERGRLVRGESITLADGAVITPDMVLGETIEGAKLVYVGDTGRTDNLTEYVQGADTLVIEATFLESEAEEARAFGHITAAQAARLARDNGVKSLLLNHISRRYRERDMIDEARRVFSETRVTRDLDHFVIRRGQACIRKDVVEIDSDETLLDDIPPELHD